jgi:hypothetical protein
MFEIKFFESGTNMQALNITAISISQWLEGLRINNKNPRDIVQSMSYPEPGKTLIMVSCRVR